MLYYGGFGVSLRGLAARLVVVLEGLFVVLYYGGVVSILSWEWLLYSASSYVGSNIYGGNGCLFFFAEGFFVSLFFFYLSLLVVKRGLVQRSDRRCGARDVVSSK